MNWRDYLTEAEAREIELIEDIRRCMAYINIEYRAISERARKRGARAMAKGEK